VATRGLFGNGSLNVHPDRRQIGERHEGLVSVFRSL
jgi:hypothetical protein